MASFRELKVYEAAMAGALAVFRLARTLPRSERHSLQEQVLRSSRAVPALIAEAWARRAYTAAFREKLSQALAEAMETEVWLTQLRDCEYCTPAEATPLIDTYQHIAAMLTLMIQKAPTFTPKNTNP